MGLYRMMLVDDEEEVRKAMIRKMDWERGMRATEKTPWRNWSSWSRMWL